MLKYFHLAPHPRTEEILMLQSKMHPVVCDNIKSTLHPSTIIPFSQSPCKAASITCIVTFSFFVQILILRLQFFKCFQQGHLSFWYHKKGQRRHHLPYAPHTILEHLQRNLSFVQFCWKVKIHEQQSCSSALWLQRFSFYRGLFT